VSVAARKGLIALYIDALRDDSRALGIRVANRFKEAGYTITLCPGSDPQLPAASDGAKIADALLLVTIGGDGTLLRAARLVVNDGVPLIGINTGRLGFLTEFDEDDPRIDQLPQLLAKGLEIEERLALQAHYDGRSFFALNDVVVRKGEVSRIVPFGLGLNDEQAGQIPADGICIATPTGSTAYFLSAGGSIISPQVEAIGIVPLLPHTLFSRPLIVPATSRIHVSCDSEIVRAQLECDGEAVSEVAPGASVFIERHPRTVRFARPARLHFFERLEDKMRWGVSIKDPRRV
jgi:NAD+ kinase